MCKIIRTVALLLALNGGVANAIGIAPIDGKYYAFEQGGRIPITVYGEGSLVVKVDGKEAITLDVDKSMKVGVPIYGLKPNKTTKHRVCAYQVSKDGVGGGTCVIMQVYWHRP